MAGDRDSGLVPYPGSPYPVQLPDHADPAVLPAGHGAVAIHARHPASHLGAVPPIIGIDGKPATFGFGRAVVIVSAGERQIEVQEGRPRLTTVVNVGEGQVVEFDYSPSQKQPRRAPRGETGLLDRWPGVRSDAVNRWTSLAIGIAGLVWTIFIVVITVIGGVPAVGALGAVVGLLAAAVGYRNWRATRRPTRRKGDR